MPYLSSPRTRRRGRRAIAAASALALTATLGAVSPPASATVRPALALEATVKTVTTELYGGRIYPDLGVYAVAGSDPFEIRAFRDSYAQKLVSFQSRAGADLRLPPGSAAENFSGLRRFFTVTFTNTRTGAVTTTHASFCPNGDYYQGQVRRRPDAPASSPYPTGCGGNPYTLGAVWGLQAGYAVPALSYADDGIKAKLGTYTVTVEVARAYRSLFGISAREGRATLTLKVVKPSDDVRQVRPHRPVGVVLRPDANAIAGPAGVPSGPLPDLRALPAWSIGIEAGRYLDFAATVWNAGPSTMVVDGFRRPDNDKLMDAYEYFFDAAGNQVGYAPVGTMEWDPRPGHEHWHFTDFATYRLLDKQKKLVVRSQKEAFCLANTDAVDYTLPTADWNPDNTDLHTACGERGSIGVREVLAVGSGDTYVQDLPGQSFDLKGLKNGIYYIEVRANPKKKLYEASTGNNVSYRKVKISGTNGHRTVKVYKVGIISE